MAYVDFTLFGMTTFDLSGTTMTLGMNMHSTRGAVPTIAEITSGGTVTIQRKPKGQTGFSTKVNNAAMTKQDGGVYYQRVFNAASGYLEGDTLLFIFKNVQVTIGGTVYELINNGTGLYVYSEIRETIVPKIDIIAADVVNIDGDAMRGTDGANIIAPNTVIPDPAGTQVTVATNNDKTDYRLSSVGVDDIFDEVIEATQTLRTLLRIFTAALAGKSTGGGTPNSKFRDIADGKNRIESVNDSDGNRDSIVLDGS